MLSAQSEQVVKVRGYTLLELLVVLALLGLLTGLTVPRLVTLYERSKVAYERDEILSLLNGLSYQAWRHKQVIDLNTYPDSSLSLAAFEFNLPNNWQLKTLSPIHYQANGICSGGTVLLLHQTQVFQYDLTAPFCQTS